MAVNKKIWIISVALVLLIAAIGLLGIRGNRQTANREEWIQHTLEVLQRLAELQVDLLDAETGQRGYLLTGDEEYLKQLQNGIEGIQKDLTTLFRLIMDNPGQQSNLLEIKKLVGDKTAELDETVRLHRNGDPAALRIVKTDLSKQKMVRIREIITDMKNVAFKQLSTQQASAGSALRSTFTTILTMIVIMLLMIPAATFLLSRSVIRQRQSQVERDEVEIERRDAQTRMNAIVKTAVDGIITIDEEGVVLSFNHAAEKIFGYTASEVIGQKINILQPEPIRSEHDAYLRNYLKTGIKKIIGIGREVTGRRKDGTPVHMHLSVAEMKLDGRILFSGILRDITQEKAMRENLEDLTRRMTLATQSAQMGIWDLNINTNELIWDDIMFTLYGITPDHSTGAYDAWKKGVHPEDIAKAEAELKAAIRSDNGLDTQFRVIWPGGEIRTLKASGYVLRDDTGRALRMIGVNWDITPLKAAEEEMKRAKETAEAASRSKSEFLANMSHEIRTPLNGVMGMIEVLLNTQVTPRQKEFLTMARQSAENLLSVINDILDFSKIEAGKLVIDRHPFPLRDTVEGVVSTMGIPAEEKNLELTCRIAPEVPDHLVGDAGRIRQVLINVINNAIKFTDDGEIAVEVTLDGGTGPDGDVLPHISVRDTGIGIVPEKQKQIFEAFSQADASTTRRFGGTGLGLSISSQLVALMGGRIWVESEPGRGSTFHFTVKTAMDFSLPDEPAPADVKIKGLHVMVVDDNATNRRILGEMLPAWGIRVALAEDGHEALRVLDTARAAGTPFDLVLTDYHMPGMNGLQLAGRIREDPSNAGMRIVLLSSSGKLNMEESLFQKLIDDSLTKPVRKSDLLQMIRKTLGLSPMEASGLAARKALRPLRILLAEDSLINQVVATELLQNAGHEVTLADNGLKALEALKEKSFDVVLMDVQMPEMDGLEATRAIRNYRSAFKNHEIPIIAMTAHAMKGDRERCLEAGMNGYVSKPILPQELFEALKKVVPAGNAGSAAPKADPGVFSLEKALETVDGKRTLLNRIVDIFLEKGPGLVVAVKAALETGDPETVRDTAHLLKGSVGNFGAKAAFETAQRLEQIGASGDLTDGPEAYRKLSLETDRLLQALADFRKGEI